MPEKSNKLRSMRNVSNEKHELLSYSKKSNMDGLEYQAMMLDHQVSEGNARDAIEDYFKIEEHLNRSMRSKDTQ